MAGIYIHVPFCRKICSYCDFYKTTLVKLLPAYIDALARDLDQRKSFFNGDTIETIYFGGGTPSLLNAQEINTILECINRYFQISSGCEITLEANPDDLSPFYFRMLRDNTAVNRISIGIQSFDDNHLVLLNRRHNAGQALLCIEQAMQSGFSNVSLDLIYGIPGMDVSGWKRNLDTAFSLGIQHISAYHLTIEPHTALSRMVGRGLLQLPEEDTSTKQFLMLHHMALEHGFVHYEISNLAKAGFISKHNTGYWKDKKYLGIGPSAHSFDGLTRQWNVPDTQKYIASVNQGQSYYESEKLDRKMRFNEYIMVSLRTMWGVDTTYITGEFGKAAAIHFRSSVRPFLETGILLEHNGSITMTPEGWLISDYIITRLMQE